MEIIKTTYERLCVKPSDINEHLPTICRYAQDCESVFETGVRGCVSSWAILYGLTQNNKSEKFMFMNDIDVCKIDPLIAAANSLPPGLKVAAFYKWQNNLEIQLPRSVDMTYIDTWHVYAQLKRELAKFAPLTNKYIVMHDTTVDEVYGETIRNGWNAAEQSKKTGFPVAEINCGLGRAIEEFLAANPEWELREKYTNNHGLTVLKRI